LVRNITALLFPRKKKTSGGRGVTTQRERNDAKKSHSTTTSGKWHKEVEKIADWLDEWTERRKTVGKRTQKETFSSYAE